MHIKGYPPRGGISTTSNNTTDNNNIVDNNNDKAKDEPASPITADGNTNLTKPVTSTPTALDNHNSMDFRQITLNSQQDVTSSSPPPSIPLTPVGGSSSPPSLSSPHETLSSPHSLGTPSPHSMSLDSARSDTDRDDSLYSASPATPTDPLSQQLQQPQQLHLRQQQELHHMQQAQHHHQQQQEQSTPGTPVYPVVPVKRRVGRPPGTTKKARTSYESGPDRQSRQNANGLTLRKFFELGGRDYSEFLALEKSNKVQSHSERQSKPPTSATGFHPANQSLTTMPNSPVVTSPVQSPAVQGLQYQATHLCPAGALPALRPGMPPRVNTKSKPPELIDMRDMPGFSTNTTSPLPYPGSPPLPSPEQQAILLKQNHLFLQHQRFKQQQQQELQSSQQQASHIIQRALQTPPLTQPLLVHNGDPAALDLSAKARPNQVPTISPMVRPPVMEIKPTQMEDISSPWPNPAELRRTPVEIRPSGQDGKTDINGNHAVSLENKGTGVSENKTIETWDVQQVVQFVSSIPTCQEYAEAFREQRIDGTTLPHLSEEHLLNFMKMKLGPALRLRMALKRFII